MDESLPGLLLPVPTQPLTRAEIDAVMSDLAADIRSEFLAQVADMEEMLGPDPDRDELLVLEGEVLIRASYIMALDRDHLLDPSDRDELIAEAQFVFGDADVPDLGPPRSLDELIDEIDEDGELT